MKKILFFILLMSPAVMAQNAVSFTQVSKKGTPLIFLPHIGCSSEMWADIVPHYRETHTVYLADFAGFNGKTPVSEPYTDAYIKDIQQFIRQNKLRNVILVGQNYGAFVAVKAAVEGDLSVRALVASDFYPKLSQVLDPQITREKLEQLQTGIRQGIMESDEATFTANQKQTAEMMNFMNAEDVSRFVEWQRKSDRKTLAETLCEQLETNLLPALKENKTPILVLSTWYFAKKYRNMPLSEADKKLKEMYGDTPNITHAVTEEAKDFMASDQPEWFISRMDKFLEEIERQAKDI